MNIELIASNIELRDGIWYSKSRSGIFYPEDANDVCFELENSGFFWFIHRNNCIVEIVKQFNPGKEPLIDIGGGNGFVSEAIGKEDIETVLIEPGSNGIANAKKRGLKNLVCFTFEDAQLINDSLPNVGLFDVLEHIENDTDFLQKIFSCLKPGGKVFITVPAYQFLWSNEDVHAGHFRRYTLNTIHKKLETCGFEVLYETYLFSFLSLPIFLFRTLPGIFKTKHKKTARKNNKMKNGIVRLPGLILNPFMEWELRKIRRRERVRFGTSCLIVAIKK